MKDKKKLAAIIKYLSELQEYIDSEAKQGKYVRFQMSSYQREREDLGNLIRLKGGFRRG